MNVLIAAVTSLIITTQALPQAMIFPDDPKILNATKPREGRQFSFPSTEQSSVIHNGHEYVIHSAEKTSFPDSAVSETQSDRQFSLLSPLKGLQVGLDFRMPFFNIPMADLLSGILRPGQSAFSSPENALSLGNSRRAMSALAAVAATSMLFFPKILNAVGFGQDRELYREGAQPEDYFKNVNKVLADFNIDGSSCAQMALCTIGSAQRAQRSSSRAGGTTTYLDVIESLLNLSSVKKTLDKTGWRQAKQYGWESGNCDIYNPLNKCPLDASTWSQILVDVGKYV